MNQKINYKYIYGFFCGFIFALGTNVLYMFYYNPLYSPLLLENIR